MNWRSFTAVGLQSGRVGHNHTRNCGKLRAAEDQLTARVFGRFGFAASVYSFNSLNRSHKKHCKVHSICIDLCE